MLSFLVDTYEIAIPRGKDDGMEGEEGETATDAEGEHPAKRGRKPNERSHYLQGHPRHSTKQRIVRTKGHRHLPSFIGPYFPRKDDGDRKEYYSCNVLALLKPWRKFDDLKGVHETWSAALEEFMEQADKETCRVVCNLQYYYECSDSANDDSEAERSQRLTTIPGGLRSSGSNDDGDEEALGEDVAAATEVTEEDVRQLENNELRTDNYGREALEIGRLKGIFADDAANSPWVVEGALATAATGDDLVKLEQWKAEMAKQVEEVNAAQEPEMIGPERDCGNITQLQVPSEEAGVQHIAEPETSGTDSGPDCGQSRLLRDQRRAFDIVRWHLEETLGGRKVEQLLMHIPGEGGTGKSKVIQTVSALFEELGCAGKLTRAAYTGIAASIIEGKTFHTLLSLPMNGQLPSKDAILQLVKLLGGKAYLIIDEISMVAREFLAKISAILGMIRDAIEGGGMKNDLPFGGLNVIIVGDLHQFPPIACKAKAPLYYPNLPSDGNREMVGRTLYEHFRTVVILEEQVRIVDPTWRDFLAHARIGQCQPHHMKMLRSLILTDTKCPKTDFSKPPWSNAVLVTPRHSVRIAWNHDAVRKHCRQRKEVLYTCRAQDRIHGRRLTLAERLAVATKATQGIKGRNERGGLPNLVEFAKGMEVMVTFNVKTDLDVANGSRGQIVDIILDENEPEHDVDEHQVELHYMPACLLVKMDRTKARALPGLPEGVLPLVPLSKQFKVNVGPDKEQKTVTRTQLPLTAAYAFTDMRSQGQTIGHVVVDIGKPPTGGPLTPFNAYVALSRSSGRETIRLLRDFDDSLFTTLPSLELEVEDQRLKDLNEETKVWWAAKQLEGRIDPMMVEVSTGGITGDVDMLTT